MAAPADPELKKKIIQLIVIERVRAGQLLIEVSEAIERGEEPDSRIPGALGARTGKILALLWVLREMEPDRQRFFSLIETFGFKPEDDEMQAIDEIDADLAAHGSMAGELSFSAMKTRERKEED